MGEPDTVAACGTGGECNLSKERVADPAASPLPQAHRLHFSHPQALHRQVDVISMGHLRPDTLRTPLWSSFLFSVPSRPSIPSGLLLSCPSLNLLLFSLPLRTASVTPTPPSPA